MGPFDSKQVATWIRAARAGDDRALSELIGAAMEYLFPAALGMIRERHRQGSYLTDVLHNEGVDLVERMRDDAWAITHAACCRMALKLDTFRGRNSIGREVHFSTWLYAIAKNEMRNLLRGRWREAKRRWHGRATGGESDDTTEQDRLGDLIDRTAAATAAAPPAPDRIAEANDDRRIVLEALEEAPLTPEQKESVLLYYGLGLKQERIAALTGVQVGTVKKRLFDGLRKLKSYVKERSDAPTKREGRA